MTRTWLVIAVLCASLAAAEEPAAESVAAESVAERDARMSWWRQARFGLFIHWGLYAIPAGEWQGRSVGGVGEWIMYHGQIPVADYEPLVEQFDPVDFDADEWAELAVEAGMGYVVITTKHHDGFCLFASEHTTYDIEATPFRRDIMAELAPACRKRGLGMGWYHSILDWHHPDYLPRRSWDSRPSADADPARYFETLEAQVSELLTRYGDISVMWFDGEWEDTWTHSRGLALYRLVRELQPRIIVNNRVDKGRRGMQGLDREGDFAGDFGTPEQEVPGAGLPGVDWETCMTMNDTWGFKADDDRWKSSGDLVRTLVDVASKGGNLLLNVGPDARGRIPAASAERLRAIGRWMSRHGESIRGTSAGGLPRQRWGRVTSRATEEGGVRLYLHVFEWPADGDLVVRGLRSEPVGAFVLGAFSPGPTDAQGDPAALEHVVGRDGLTLRLPERAPDGEVSVIVIDLDSAPLLEAVRVFAGADGVLHLLAEDAELNGSSLRLEGESGAENIGFWTSPDDRASWELEIETSGPLRLFARIACAPAHAGGVFELQCAGQEVELEVSSTGGWQDYVEVEVGSFDFDRPGAYTLTVVHPSSRQHALNLRELRLER